MSAPATTATVTAAVTTTTPSNYYEFNHYSGKLHDWSMSCISFDNIAWAPVGLVTLVAATVARVFEGALMAIVNSILAVKNCICGAAEEVAPPAPVVVTPPVTAPPSPPSVHAGSLRERITDRHMKRGFTAAVTAGGAGVAASYGVAAAGLTAMGAPVLVPLAATGATMYGAYIAAGKFLYPEQAQKPVTVIDASVAGRVATQPSNN